METYRVEFKLYQYNSGAADNGTFTKGINCSTLEEAKSIKTKIDKTYINYEFDDNLLEGDNDAIWVNELIYKLTPCGGFLKSIAEIYLISKTKIE
jgi:hypothetical protein